ncbi:uncharacterized protein LOC135201862 [Macrobrachium nipponense]|uniref:uncharacterized protein LOC135201862 n=1 Tax=Macrobrachium nipponense TaxID=159736 RepID=UPI0030C82CFE
MENIKVKIEPETSDCEQVKCSWENAEDDDDYDDDDDKAVTSSHKKLILPFSVSENEQKSFKSWDFKRKPSKSSNCDAEKIENQDKSDRMTKLKNRVRTRTLLEVESKRKNIESDSKKLKDKDCVPQSTDRKSDVHQTKDKDKDESTKQLKGYEIKKIRSPTNWKNFTQFIFLGHSRFIYNSSIPASEKLPAFQVFSDPELKLDNIESVLKAKGIDFKKDSLLICSIGVDDFLDVKLTVNQNQSHKKDLSAKSLIAKAKQIMRKVRRLFTKDSEVFLINVLPVDLRKAYYNEKISSLSSEEINEFCCNISDSIRAFNNYFKLSVPQKLREKLQKYLFTTIKEETHFINTHMYDGLNLTRYAVDTLSGIIAFNLKNYISFKGLFRYVVLVGDLHLENIVKVWPGDRFNCTVLVVPNYKLTDIRQGSPLLRALVEYKNSLIILNLGTLDLYDNQYFSCPECKTAMKFIVPKTVSVRQEILKAQIRAIMENVKHEIKKSLDGCQVLFSHSHIIDVVAHHKHIFEQHSDKCNKNNVKKMFDPSLQENKTAIKELFHVAESYNELASCHNKSNGLPIWDKSPYIYGCDYKSRHLLPYSFPSNTFVDGINLTPDTAQRIAEHFHFSTEEILALKLDCEKEESKKPITADLKISEIKTDENNKTLRKIDKNKVLAVPIQISKNAKKPKSDSQTTDLKQIVLPFVPPNFVNSVPNSGSVPPGPPPYHGGFTGHDYMWNGSAAPVMPQNPMGGNVLTSNTQPAPWTWEANSYCSSFSGQTYSATAPITGQAGPYPMQQIGQPGSYYGTAPVTGQAGPYPMQQIGHPDSYYKDTPVTGQVGPYPMQQMGQPDSFYNAAPVRVQDELYPMQQNGQPVSYEAPIQQSGQPGSYIPLNEQTSSYMASAESSVLQWPRSYSEPVSSSEIRGSVTHQRSERSSLPEIQGKDYSVSSWQKRSSPSHSLQVSRALSSSLSLKKHDKNSLDLDDWKPKNMSSPHGLHKRDHAHKRLHKTHPKYAEEQTNFIRFKVQNCLDRGQKPDMDSILKDWEHYWDDNFVKLSEDSRTAKRENRKLSFSSYSKQSCSSDSFVSSGNSESNSESSDNSSSSDSEDHKRCRKSKYKKEVRLQDRRSSSDRRGTGVKKRINTTSPTHKHQDEPSSRGRGNSNSSPESASRVSDAHTKWKKHRRSPFERRVDSMRKRKQNYLDRRHKSSRREESYSPSDRENDQGREQSFSPRRSEKGISNSISPIDREFLRREKYSQSPTDRDINLMREKNKYPLLNKKIEGSHSYGRMRRADKEKDIDEDIIVTEVGEDVTHPLHLEGLSSRMYKETSKSGECGDLAFLQYILKVKESSSSQQSTSIVPESEELQTNEWKKKKSYNSETVEVTSKKSCNVLEVFEVLCQFGDNLGNLKSPLELLYSRALQIHSSGLEAASLLNDKDNLTLLYLVSSKLKKSVKCTDLSIIQKVIIDEALVRLDNFLENTLPQ